MPSAAGTACTIISLVRMGVGRRDPQIVAATNFMCSDQRRDGGWSKPSLADYASLTLITCLSLQALADVGITSGSASADEGLRWIQKAQNADRGWGNTAQDEQSDITATAYAIRALGTSDGATDSFKETIDLGAEWIARQQNPDGGWGIRHSEPSSLAHTAHAVEGLLAAGYQGGLLDDARQWLMGKLLGDPLAPWDELYRLPAVLAAGLPPNLRRSGRLRWTHLPTQRSLIALLKLGVDPSDTIIKTLVADLAKRHEGKKYWRVQTMPDVAASWAILESVNALSLYREAMERVRPVVAFREVIRELIPRVESLETQNMELASTLESLRETVSTLSAPRHRWTRRLRRFLLAPATRVGGVLVVTSSVLLLYLEMWSRGSDAGARLIGVATIIVPALTLLEMIRRMQTH